MEKVSSILAGIIIKLYKIIFIVFVAIGSFIIRYGFCYSRYS